MPKFVQEHPRKLDGTPTEELEIPNLVIFKNLKASVDKVVSQSQYNKVDLAALFSFMNQ